MFSRSFFQKEIFFTLLALGINFAVNAANSIEGIRVWPAPQNTRVVFDLKQKPEYTYFSLSNPYRLVIDFKNSKNAVTLENIAAHDKRILKIRTSTSKKTGATRLVLELARNYPKNIFSLPPASPYGNRLVVDLHNKKQTIATTYTKKEKPLRDIIIGIDAGHGGEDPGSIGRNGTYEKRVTLAISKKLQHEINSHRGMKAILTRSGDYFVSLNGRTQIAREKEVDFLISIHADAFRTPQPHGASVWVISKGRAESEMGRFLVNREKNSELLGGVGAVIKNTDDKYLARTLADLSKEHSYEESHGVAQNVLSELKGMTKLHKTIPQNASFSVLKSSDIPSILVETGFISNYAEEKSLNSSSYQKKLAMAISKGVKKHFTEHPLQGSYLATQGYKNYKVASGDSLSVLAQRYNVTMKEIKAANNLKSTVLRIGQTLKIPRAG